MSPHAGLDPKTRPNLYGQARSHNWRPAVPTGGPSVTTGGPRSHNRKALGRSSAQYSFYVPRRTSQPGEALSRAAPPKVHILSAAERNRRGVQRARNPSHAHPRRFHDAGPGLDGTATEHRKAYRPSPAAHHPTTACATERSVAWRAAAARAPRGGKRSRPICENMEAPGSEADWGAYVPYPGPCRARHLS